MQQFAIGAAAVLGVVLFVTFGMRSVALLLSVLGWGAVAVLITLALLQTLTAH